MNAAPLTHFPTTSTDGRTVWACCLDPHGDPCGHRSNPDGTAQPVASLPIEVTVHQTVTGGVWDGSCSVVCSCLWQRDRFPTRHAARRAGDEHLAVANADPAPTPTEPKPRTCRDCGAPIEPGHQMWVDARSGDDGGTYDICPERYDVEKDGPYGHWPQV